MLILWYLTIFLSANAQHQQLT